jgi:hypothetical protein
MGMGRRLKGMMRGMSITKEEMDPPAPVVEEAGEKAGSSGWNLQGLMISMKQTMSTAGDLPVPSPGEHQASAVRTPRSSLTAVGSMLSTARSDNVIKSVAGAVYAHSAVSEFMFSPKTAVRSATSARESNLLQAEFVHGERNCQEW